MALSVVVVGITHWHAPRYLRMLAARGARVMGASDADPVAGARVAESHGVSSYAETYEVVAADPARSAVILQEETEVFARAVKASGAKAE